MACRSLSLSCRVSLHKSIWNALKKFSTYSKCGLLSCSIFLLYGCGFTNRCTVMRQRAPAPWVSVGIPRLGYENQTFVQVSRSHECVQCPTWPSTGICTSGQSGLTKLCSFALRILRNLSPNLGTPGITWDHLGFWRLQIRLKVHWSWRHLWDQRVPGCARTCQDSTGIAGTSCTTFRPSWSAIRSKAAWSVLSPQGLSMYVDVCRNFC